MKKIIVLLSLLLLACPQAKKQEPVQEESAQPQATQTTQEVTVFKAAMTTNPQSLDESVSNTTATRQVSLYVYETLFTFGEKYDLIPQLALDYKRDGIDYIITLRQGVKFHNGQEMTADDVKASFDRFAISNLAGSRFVNVKEVQVVDKYTVRFVLAQDMILPEELALPSRVVIMPKAIADKYGKEEIKAADVIGTGPYKLLEWRPDVYTRLGKFAEYVPDDRFADYNGMGGKRIAVFEEIQLIPAPEAESRIAGLETGEFDYAEGVPVTSYDRIAGNSAVTPYVVKPRWAVVMELNHSAPFIKDVRFRQALIAALDMEKVMQAVTTSKTEFYRLQPSIFTPEQYFFTEAGSAGVYNKPDLAKVKTLLAESGYKGEEIVYLYNKDFDWMYKAAIAAADQWQKAGINVVLELHDWPAQINKALGLKDWAINQSGWSPRLDPSHTNGYFNSTSSGAYGYNNPQMDAYLAELSLGKTPAERKAIWEQAQKLVWDDATVIRVGDYFELEGIRAKYQGYKPFFVLPRFWNLQVK